MVASETTITLPAAGEISVALYDLPGNNVGVISRGWRATGEHVLHIEGTELASGLYTIRLEGNGIRLSVPVVVNR